MFHIAIWALNMVGIFILGMLVMERVMGGRLHFSVSSSRMTYPRVGAETPYGRSLTLEGWLGGRRP